jgi:tetratricopeptide (TPR) repeat protein
LFVEELIGHLGPSPSNHALLERGEQVDLDLPHSLRLVIGRWLGLVSRESARILDTAAVIGRSFPFALLEAATHSDPDRLLDSVEEAEKAGLISSKLEYPEARFQFAHELIRWAVLDEVSIARRQPLHLNIAEALELLHPNNLEAHAEDLAYHFWSAGAAAEPARAIGYLQMAGEKAERRSAFKEAQGSYEQALALLSLLPQSAERDLQELEVRQSIIRMLSLTTGTTSPESVDARERAVALAKKSGNLSQLLSLTFDRARAAHDAGDYKSAATLADEVLELALREGNPTNLGLAYALQVSERYILGDLAGSEEYFARGLKFFEDATIWSVPFTRVNALSVASYNAWMGGRADLARAISSHDGRNKPEQSRRGGVVRSPQRLLLSSPQGA